MEPKEPLFRIIWLQVGFRYCKYFFEWSSLQNWVLIENHESLVKLFRTRSRPRVSVCTSRVLTGALASWSRELEKLEYSSWFSTVHCLAKPIGVVSSKVTVLSFAVYISMLEGTRCHIKSMTLWQGTPMVAFRRHCVVLLETSCACYAWEIPFVSYIYICIYMHMRIYVTLASKSMHFA